MPDIPQLVVNESEAAKLLQLSPRTMQRLRHQGGGPPFVRLTEHRIGYQVAALQDWVRERSAASTSSPAPGGRKTAA